MSIEKCENYSKEYCNTALGLDGKCKYDPTNTKCR